MSYGEVLTEQEMSSGLTATIWKSHHQSIKAIGCKVFYEQLALPQFASVFDEIKNDHDIKIIDLHRENKLEAFVSFKIAKQTGAWTNDAGGQSIKQKMSIKISEFEQFVNQQAEVRRKTLQVLKNHEIYTVSYERLTKNTESELDKIQLFLGTRPRKLFSLLHKQNPEPLEDLISNYHELKQKTEIAV